MQDPSRSLIGTVKSFSPHKGWGMILPEDGGADVFFHREMCHIPYSVRIWTGDRLRYALSTDPSARGPRASDVWLADAPEMCPCCGARRQG